MFCICSIAGKKKKKKKKKKFNSSLREIEFYLQEAYFEEFVIDTWEKKLLHTTFMLLILYVP